GRVISWLRIGCPRRWLRSRSRRDWRSRLADIRRPARRRRGRRLVWGHDSGLKRTPRAGFRRLFGSRIQGGLGRLGGPANARKTSDGQNCCTNQTPPFHIVPPLRLTDATSCKKQMPFQSRSSVLRSTYRRFVEREAPTHCPRLSRVASRPHS